MSTSIRVPARSNLLTPLAHAGGRTNAAHPVVREKAREMLDKEDKDFSGVLSTAKTALTLYSMRTHLDNYVQSGVAEQKAEASKLYADFIEVLRKRG
jgi:type IV secretory pathway TraG/TraD family ATPase VirD4